MKVFDSLDVLDYYFFNIQICSCGNNHVDHGNSYLVWFLWQNIFQCYWQSSQEYKLYLEFEFNLFHWPSNNQDMTDLYDYTISITIVLKQHLCPWQAWWKLHDQIWTNYASPGTLQHLSSKANGFWIWHIKVVGLLSSLNVCHWYLPK